MQGNVTVISHRTEDNIIVWLISIFFHVMLYKRDKAEENKNRHTYYDEIHCPYLNKFS